MDAREAAARCLENAQAEEEALPEHARTPLPLMGILLAIKRHLDAIDEDLQKLRRELQIRNGGENG
jgi:hypothetical protein